MSCVNIFSTQQVYLNRQKEKRSSCSLLFLRVSKGTRLRRDSERWNPPGPQLPLPGPRYLTRARRLPRKSPSPTSIFSSLLFGIGGFCLVEAQAKLGVSQIQLNASVAVHRENATKVRVVNLQGKGKGGSQPALPPCPFPQSTASLCIAFPGAWFFATTNLRPSTAQLDNFTADPFVLCYSPCRTRFFYTMALREFKAPVSYEKQQRE